MTIYSLDVLLSQFATSPLFLTVASWPTHGFLRRQIRWSGIPISWRIFQFVVIHIVKGFSIVNKAEVHVFLEFSCFIYDPRDVDWRGNDKSLQYSCLENPWRVWKGKKIGHWKMNSPGWEVPNMLPEKSGKITLERMKRYSQSKNNIQLWMWLLMEVKSDAIKNNIA